MEELDLFIRTCRYHAVEFRLTFKKISKEKISPQGITTYCFSWLGMLVELTVA